MSRTRLLLVALVGTPAVAFLLGRLPADVFASARAFLLVAASALLLLAAGALFLLPARRVLAAVFALPLTLEGRAVGLPPEDETRTVLVQPLAAAGLCLGVVALATWLR